jgi:predicted Zn-dependent protease
MMLPLLLLVMILTGGFAYPAFSQAPTAFNSSQAQYDTSNNQIPPTAPDQQNQLNSPDPKANDFPSESLIPEFGKPLPQVPSPAPTAGPAVQRAEGSPISPGQSLISKRLGLLEQTILGSTYYEHDPLSRLEHLEREVLGSIGLGNPDFRLAKLESTVLGRSGFGAGENPSQTGITGGQNFPPANLPVAGDHNVLSVASAIPFDDKAGDYLNAIQSLKPGQLAHWSNFPIRIHLPKDSVEQWQKGILKGIAQWNQYIPLATSSPNESADIEIVWVNHLVPNLLGVTRLVIATGRMHVTVFMLRPSFYAKEVSERTLEPAFLHELGHALGLFGHSDDPLDIMYPFQLADDGKLRTRHWSISARDVNTLRKVYQSANYPKDFTSPRPIEWGWQCEP